MVTVGVHIAYIDVNLHYSIFGTHPGRYLTLAGLLGRARACHQTRGGVGIIVHIPGHRRRPDLHTVRQSIMSPVALFDAVSIVVSSGPSGPVTNQ